MASLVADYGASSGSESDSDSGTSDGIDNIFKGKVINEEELQEAEERKTGGKGETGEVGEDKEEEEEEVEEDNDDDDDDDNDNDNDDDNNVNGSEDYHKRHNSSNNRRDQNLAASKDKLPLPTPDFNGTPTLKTSVFSNPFVEAEKAKSAILEKHVKMTPTLDDTKMINGKKICWNYRKGRCRFGHNCTFAHDSDLHRTAVEIDEINVPQETLICQTPYNGQVVTIENDDEIDQENDRAAKRKKRPGLSHSLIPSKKVLKMYKAQQTRGISS